MAKVKKLMRILGGYITHLSLCAAGANNIQTIYKSDDGEDQNVTLSSVSKDMTEQGEIYSAVYVPEMTDLQGDIASAEAIKQLAYSFSKAGKGIDIMHNEKVMPKDAVYVAESFIIQKEDPRFAGMTDYDNNPVDVTGGWGVVIKVDDENLRSLYRSGEWQGISMGGVTAKRPLAEAVKKEIVLKIKDIKMTPEEMKALLEASNKSLVESLVPALGEVIAKAAHPEKNEEAEAKAAAAKKKKDAEPSETQKSFLAGYPMPVMPANPDDATMVHFEKCIQVYQLAKATNAEVAPEILEFHRAKKEIMEGKEVTIKKTFAADPWGFQRTNQDAGPKGVTKTNDVDPIRLDASPDDMLSGDEVTAILKSVPAYKDGKTKIPA